MTVKYFVMTSSSDGSVSRMVKTESVIKALSDQGERELGNKGFFLKEGQGGWFGGCIRGF